MIADKVRRKPYCGVTGTARNAGIAVAIMIAAALGLSACGGSSSGSPGSGTPHAALSWACNIVYGQAGGQPNEAEFQATNPAGTAQPVATIAITYTGGTGLVTNTVTDKLTVPANGTSQTQYINPAPDAATGCQISSYSP